MQIVENSLSSQFDDPKRVGVERGITEFRAGRPVVMLDGERAFLVLPVDGVEPDRISKFLRLAQAGFAQLALTEGRARAIGLTAAEPVTLTLTTNDIDTILALVSGAGSVGSLNVVPAERALRAALDLAKFAYRLPAVLVVDGETAQQAARDPSVVTVAAEAVDGFHHTAAMSLKIAGEAKVPLENGVKSRFVIFRNAFGGDSAAVIVGEPNFQNPVPVRLHSACLTGDVFGSRRCDCGAQLRMALTELAASGGGIILYLDQEGRGLGLANKMRAYGLQDEGFDTVDANMSLGFDDDERDYGIAGQMLKMLGCTRVHLFTNNPAKVSGLERAGIEISARMPLLAPVNVDNRRYLTTKAMRAGHSLDYLLDNIAKEIREDTPG